MHLMFLSSGLGFGGAEFMLANLVSDLIHRGHRVTVIGLRSPHGMSEILRKSGAMVIEPASNTLGASLKLLLQTPLLVAKGKPDLLQGWMYHGCLAASLLGLLFRRPVAWSLHHSNFDPAYNRRATLASIRLCAWASKILPPAEIAYCGPNSRDAHHRHGFATTPASILPNGVDFTRFAPSAEVRAQTRALLGLDDASIVVGIFANRVAIKDHPTFFKAAAALAAENNAVRFLCCGRGMDATASDLLEKHPELAGRVLLLGRREDVPALMNTCDIIALSSRGESFPMALTEAVACGVPVVASDVGDCAWVVGEQDRVFAPGDSAALAKILSRLATMPRESRRALGEANRARMKALVAIPVVADTYLEFAGRCLRQPSL